MNNFKAIAKEHLTRLGVDYNLLDRYEEPHRFYHTLKHIETVWESLSKVQCVGEWDYNILFLATVFHDIVYNPQANDNEEKSAELFEKSYDGDSDIKDHVIRIILDTKTHNSSSGLSKVFCEADLDILRQPLDKLIEYEHQIFKEFQFVDYKKYKEGRIAVLQSLAKAHDINLDNLIAYVKTRRPNIGVYCGSFDPWHRGHYAILKKAEAIFDKVIIARGNNLEKGKKAYPMPEYLWYRQNANYYGLLTDFINVLDYDVTIIRGLRNVTDFQYEATQYQFLKDLKPDIKVISIFCDKEFEHISSSAIRVLEKYGKHHQYL